MHDYTGYLCNALADGAVTSAAQFYAVPRHDASSEKLQSHKAYIIALRLAQIEAHVWGLRGSSIHNRAHRASYSQLLDRHVGALKRKLNTAIQGREGVTSHRLVSDGSYARCLNCLKRALCGNFDYWARHPCAGFKARKLAPPDHPIVIDDDSDVELGMQADELHLLREETEQPVQRMEALISCSLCGEDDTLTSVLTCEGHCQTCFCEICMRFSQCSACGASLCRGCASIHTHDERNGSPSSNQVPTGNRSNDGHIYFDTSPQDG